MKKFLLAAVAVGALSTGAFAANDDSMPYTGHQYDVQSYSNKVTPNIAKKRFLYGESTSTINSFGETGNVSEKERILEKGGDNHDVAPY
jgi:hypothetical protein